MKFEVNIEKKYAISIIASFIILAIVGIGIALPITPGTTPNPGHALTTIQGAFAGDANLGVSLAKFCQTDGSNCPAFVSRIIAGTGITIFPTGGTGDVTVSAVATAPVISAQITCTQDVPGRSGGAPGTSSCAITGTWDVCFLTACKGNVADIQNMGGCEITGSGSSWGIMLTNYQGAARSFVGSARC